MGQENDWSRSVRVTPYGMYIECGGGHRTDEEERTAEEIVGKMIWGEEKLSCASENKQAPLASAHACPAEEGVIEKLLKDIFGAVDETPLAKAPVREDEPLVGADDCIIRDHVVSVAFSDSVKDGVSIQCSSGASNNRKASALLRAALFFMPAYNDVKWDEFISLLYEMTHLLETMPDDVVSDQ